MFVPTAEVALAGMSLAVDLITKKANQGKLELDTDALSLSFKTQFSNQVLCVNQEVGFDFNGVKLSVIVQSVDHADVGITQRKSTGATPRGQLLQITTLSYQKQTGSPSNIVFTGSSAVAMRNDSLFRSDFDFGKMGIGGLNEQFQTMFRRAFGSRLFPGLVKQLGINHIRGILLYGPPGE